jgi:hypothetical protein
MKILSFLTLTAVLSLSACSHHQKACCAGKEKMSCAKDSCKKDSCKKEKKCADGSCSKKEKKACADDSCHKKS